MKQLKTYIASLLILTGILCAHGDVLAQKKNFVIVHGAWGGSWSFKKVAYMLTDNGHRVYRPSLTGLGERVHLSSPDITIQTNVLDVVNTILYEDLHDVILIGHSFGGAVITGVADSIPERIKQLIYLDAIVPNDGESVLSSRNDGTRGPEHESTDGYVVPRWVKDNDPLPHDVPQSLKSFTTPVSWKKKAALALPATYIHTIDDPQHPESDHFYFYASRAKRRGWKVVSMIADHNPQMTKPEELTTLLDTESK